VNKDLIKANAMLLLAAAIWGFAFVAQRAGMAHVGPFIFNGIRFLLGAASLFPLFFYARPKFRSNDLWGGLAAGTLLFVASSFQQAGMVYTTAGNAGFITGLYIVIVPFVAHFLLRHTIGKYVWAGAGLALIGLYLLSIKSGLLMQIGDLLVLACAFFWALHILTIGHFTLKIDSILLAVMQFAVCSLLSFAVGLIVEPVSMSGILEAAFPLFFAGVFSSGIAFTLQIVAQKTAHSSQAAIIMSMESLFAMFGGWWLLGEGLTLRGLIGCALMLTGVVVSQIKNRGPKGAGKTV
jgi:drug/metabolite transporter (DMT)-like permease